MARVYRGISRWSRTSSTMISRPPPIGGRFTRPRAGELVDVPLAGARRDRWRRIYGLSAVVELAKHGTDAGVLPAQRAWLLRQHPKRRRGQRRRQYRQELHLAEPPMSTSLEWSERPLPDASDAFGLIDRLIEEEKIDCFWEKPGRFVGAWTKKHFDAQARRLAMAYHGSSAVRRSTWKARAAARRNRQRLLLRRHGRRAVGQVASGARSWAAARCSSPAQQARGLYQSSGDGHPPERRRMACRDRPRSGFRRRCGDRDEWLYRQVFTPGAQTSVACCPGRWLPIIATEELTKRRSLRHR